MYVDRDVNFKVGDMVRRKTRQAKGCFAHDNGPFKCIALNGSSLTLDRAPHGSDHAYGWIAYYFEKVEAPTVSGEYILILKQGNKLKPSTTPRTYSTEAQAKAVAASMAEKHPGQDFVIFKAVGKAKAVAATVEMY